MFLKQEKSEMDGFERKKTLGKIHKYKKSNNRTIQKSKSSIIAKVKYAKDVK